MRKKITIHDEERIIYGLSEDNQEKFNNHIVGDYEKALKDTLLKPALPFRKIVVEIPSKVKKKKPKWIGKLILILGLN